MDNGRFKREESVVQDHTDREPIVLELSVFKMAWDNNDMHAVMSLEGPQYNHPHKSIYIYIYIGNTIVNIFVCSKSQ